LTNPLQLKMRGKRARLNENGDGEVDEAFWAQAAADPAANRGHDPDLDDHDRMSFLCIRRAPAEIFIILVS